MKLGTIIVAAGVGLASLSPAVASPPREKVAISVRLAGVPKESWVVTDPLSESSAKLTPVGMKDTATPYRTNVERGPSVLLCAGAADLATQCRALVPDKDRIEEFTLDQGRVVTGRCFVGKEPATAARLFVLLPGVESRHATTLPIARAHENLVTSVVTDNAGAFRIEHLAPGNYTFELYLRDGREHETEVIRIPVRRSTEPPTAVVSVPDIRLPAARTMTVFVQDSDGAPVPNPGIGLLQRTTPGAHPQLVETHGDEKGRASLAVPDFKSPAEVNCSASGFARGRVQLEMIPAVATCVVERFASIKAHVMSEEDELAKGAVLSISRSRSATVDAAGNVTMPEVVPGDYDVRIVAPGFSVSVTPVHLKPGQAEDLGTVHLNPGKLTHGYVVDAETHDPVPGALISTSDLPGGESATADAQGAFSITTDDASDTHLRVTATGFVMSDVVVPQGASEQETLVALQHGGSIEVTAWNDDGAKCAGCSIDIQRPAMADRRTADALGMARFDDLAPGDYQVDREIVHASATGVFVSGGGSLRVATVRPHEVTHIELDSPAFDIRVILTPTVDPALQLSAVSQAGVESVSADASEAFVVHKRAGESYALRLAFPSGWVRVGVIPADYQAEIFPVRLGGATIHAIAMSGGAPIANVDVILNDGNASMLAWARSGFDGSVLIPYLSAGVFTLTCGGKALPPVTVSGAGGVLEIGVIDSGEAGAH